MRAKLAATEDEVVMQVVFETMDGLPPKTINFYRSKWPKELPMPEPSQFSAISKPMPDRAVAEPKPQSFREPADCPPQEQVSVVEQRKLERAEIKPIPPTTVKDHCEQQRLLQARADVCPASQSRVQRPDCQSPEHQPPEQSAVEATPEQKAPEQPIAGAANLTNASTVGGAVGYLKAHLLDDLPHHDPSVRCTLSTLGQSPIRRCRIGMPLD